MNEQYYAALRDRLRRENQMWIKVDGYMPPWSVLIATMIASPIVMWFL